MSNLKTCLLYVTVKLKRLGKIGKVWCGGARATHWATCHYKWLLAKQRSISKSPLFKILIFPSHIENSAHKSLMYASNGYELDIRKCDIGKISLASVAGLIKDLIKIWRTFTCFRKSFRFLRFLHVLFRSLVRNARKIRAKKSAQAWHINGGSSFIIFLPVLQNYKNFMKYSIEFYLGIIFGCDVVSFFCQVFKWIIQGPNCPSGVQVAWWT